MRDPHGLAMLACIVTYTPGTVWVTLTEDHHLKLHVLDLQHEGDWIKLVQERYERPLMEIFE
jgi:multicomponent K+:H+ antiporter subunit E